MRALNILPTLTAATVLAGVLGFSEPVSAQSVGDLCSLGTMTAATGTVTPDKLIYPNVTRYYCLYESRMAPQHRPVPLVIALHGGGGNASIMMRDKKRIIEHVEREGWVAVFPNGLPSQECSNEPCLDNFWEAGENVPFLEDLIHQIATRRAIDVDRIHLIGFSGGASLAYRVTATPDFRFPIHSIATVAGAIGGYIPDQGFILHRPEEGTPTSALLTQGRLDVRHPERGGLDSNDEWESLSHLHKVDLWRTKIGADEPIKVSHVASPANVEVARYVNGILEVVDIVDPDLAHAWPSWDLMDVIVDFFNRQLIN